MTDSPRSLARKIYRMNADIARLQAGLGTPQLASSSIEDGSVDEHDADGRLVSRIGKQIDGSHGSRVVESPAQPTPDAPDLSVGKTGVIAVRWSGGADAPVPLVHGHIEVQAMGPSDADWQVVGTIRDRSGGATTFAADESGTTQVRLVLVGQDRVTRSEASAVSTVEVELPASTSEVQAAIESADGKNVLTYDPDPPAADGQGVGDVHFQIDDVTGVPQQSWRWDGTDWVPMTFGDGMLESLSAGKITAGTIEAAVGIGSSGWIRSTDDQGRTSEMVGGGFYTEDSAGQVVFDTRGGQLVARGASVADGMITGSEYRTSSDWYTNGGVFINGPNNQLVINDSDGNTAASLGAQGNSLSGVEVQGTFRTSYENGSGATISRGDITYWSAEQGAYVTRQNTPYLRLTPRDGEKDRDPTIATDGQRLVLAPGVNSSGEALPVVTEGTLQATLGDFGNAKSRLYQVAADSGDTANVDVNGLRVFDGSSSRRFGVQRTGSDGQYQELLGEIQPLHSDQSTVFIAATGWNSIDPGQGVRGSVTYGSPAPSGRRVVQATAKVSSGTWDNSNSTSVAVSGDQASGFDWAARAPSSISGSFSFRVVCTIFWGSY